MFESPLRSLGLCIDPVSHGATLHEDDRMMSIFSCYSGGEPEDVAGLRPSRHQFEACGGQVMALVYNQLSIARNEVRHLALAHQALDQRNVDAAGRLATTTTNHPDIIASHGKKRLPPLDPLDKKLPPVQDDGRALCAIIAAAMTVLPKAVVAASTPKL